MTDKPDAATTLAEAARVLAGGTPGPFSPSIDTPWIIHDLDVQWAIHVQASKAFPKPVDAGVDVARKFALAANTAQAAVALAEAVAVLGAEMRGGKWGPTAESFLTEASAALDAFLAAATSSLPEGNAS